MCIGTRSIQTKHTDEYSIYLNNHIVADGTGAEWAMSVYKSFCDAVENAGKGIVELDSYDEDGDSVTLDSLEIA